MSCHQTSRPSVIVASRRVVAEAADDEDVLDASACRLSASSTAGLSAAGLPRRQPPSAVMTSFASASLIRPRQRLRREAAEDDGVRRADPGAGEHRDRQLRDHRHVDRDPVALLDAELLERVGGLLDLAMEVARR